MCNASWDWTFPEVERSCQIWQPFRKRQFARTVQVGVCGPGFRSVGACELTFASEKGVLWTEIFKFGRLRARILAKIEVLEAKLSKFFSKRGLVNWLLSFIFCLKWDPCELRERHEKGVFRAANPHTLFLGQCPPRIAMKQKRDFLQMGWSGLSEFSVLEKRSSI